jgi:uncharacterized membrane protein
MAHLAEWLNLALRLFHLIAGIMWIGSSFYFVWLDSSLEKPDPPKPDVEGELWMVHSGGFYSVEKRLIRPGQMPKILHWFKYEALFTWISGIFLLGIVYYLGDGIQLIDPATARITYVQAVGISLGLIVVSWLVYDLLWKFVGPKLPGVCTAISLALLGGVIWGLCQVFTGRAAYIHVGAILGTIMVANVWMRILPSQQKMIDATQAGRDADFSHGLAAKRRSMHNSYVTIPVLAIMLSNHYPVAFGHAFNWLILILIFVAGAGARHLMITYEKKKAAWWMLAPVGAAIAGLLFLTWPPATEADTGPRVPFAEANDIIVRRCLQCHSTQPTDDTFRTPPNGIVFENPQSVQALAPRIRFRSVETSTMPLANKTGMTDEERRTLGRWIAQGARTE